MPRQALFPAGAFACGLLAVLLAGCGGGAAPPATSVAAGAALPVLVAAPHLVPRERVWDGVVEAVNQATVSAQTAGRVVALPYDVDDRVPAGAVIVRFTDVEQQAAHRQAMAQVSAAAAAAREAEAEHARISSIYARRLVARSQLDQVVARRDAAKASLEAARAGLRAADEQLAYTVVRAPYAGIVTQRFVEVGETVQPGQPLLSGIGGGEMRVSVRVPQGDVDAIRAHHSAAILAQPSLPDAANADAALVDAAFADTAAAAARIPARAITVFPYADPGTHTFEVRLALPSAGAAVASGGTFAPGTTVKVAFVVGRETRMTVPVTAVVRRAELSAVYVLGAAGPRLRQVRLGHRHGNEIEVHAGLRAGERVVRDAGAALRAIGAARTDA